MIDLYESGNMRCQLIQLFHLINKIQMEGLYTFNSQQLQDLIKRPSSTDTPPNIIRKRIITSPFSKKQSLLSQASTREEMLTVSKERKISVSKKVTFLLDSPPLYQGELKKKMTSHLMKTRSLGEKNIKQEFQDDSFGMKLINRYPFSGLESGNGNSQGRLTISRQDKIVQEEKTIQTNNVGTVREKRTFSLKLSPKIVPISQRRLPKAFKIKYASSSNSKKINTNNEQKPLQRCQGLKQNQQVIQKPKQVRVIKRSRFQQMFQIQRKKFERLFRQDQ